MLDTAELSLEDYRVPSKTGYGTGTGKYRHVIDGMRTTAWFHALRLKTGAKSTYEMERRLEPESFGVDESGTAYKRNMWRRYRLGRHTPRQSLVEAMESLHPGTHEVFDHVLWDTLKSGATTPRHHLLNRLKPQVSKFMLSRPMKPDERIQPDAFFRLAGFGDFDGMAGLVALLREAIATGNADQQRSISRALYHSTLVMAPDLYVLGIAAPFIDYINTKIFILVSAEGRCEVNAKSYIEYARLCACFLSPPDGNGIYHFSTDKKVQ